jgi:subtilisin-like proprotein convertase family protein
MATVLGYYEFASTAGRVFIPDSNSAMMELTVASNLTITDIDVTINVTHTFDPDLDLFLLEPNHGPEQDTVQLYGGTGGPGVNFVNTRFDDQAETDIVDGTAPYTGSFQPVGSLLDFTNISSAGTWSLLAIDYAMLDTGYIENFTLHVTTALQAVDPFIPHPSSLILSAYPNPFNASTEFNFELSQSSPVELVVFDLTGRHVATLLNEQRAAGSYRVAFDAADLPSGVYIARLSTPSQSTAHKILLLK